MAAQDPPHLRDRGWRASDAANFVFEQVIDEDDRGAPAATQDEKINTSDGPGSAARDLQVRSMLARSADMYSDLFQRVLTTFTAEVSSTAAGIGADPPTTVQLRGHPGGVAGAMVWIHNTSGNVIPGFSLRMTELCSADGSRLAANLGITSPATFAESAQARRSAWLAISVSEDTTPGTYHGHLIAEGLPGTGVEVRLVVQ